MNDDPLDIEFSKEEKDDQEKFGKVYLITLFYLLGAVIPIIGLGIFGIYVEKNKELYPNWVTPVVYSLLSAIVVTFFVGLFLIDKFCRNKYGHSIMEASPFYRPPEQEPTKEDDQIDITLLGKQQFKKNLQKELIIDIFFSMFFLIIGVPIFFMGRINNGSNQWVGYALLGLFSLLTITGVIGSIIRYKKRMKESTRKEEPNLE